MKRFYVLFLFIFGVAAVLLFRQGLTEMKKKRDKNSQTI